MGIFLGSTGISIDGICWDPMGSLTETVILECPTRAHGMYIHPMRSPMGSPMHKGNRFPWEVVWGFPRGVPWEAMGSPMGSRNPTGMHGKGRCILLSTGSPMGGSYASHTNSNASHNALDVPWKAQDVPSCG